MTLTIRNKEIVELMKELQALSGDDMETALGPLLAAEIARRRAAKASTPQSRVYDRYIDEEPQMRVQRLKDMIRHDWKPVPPGKTFENPDDIIGYGEHGLPE